MAQIYRFASKGSEKNNPWYPRNTLRPPANVPYLVDNLWEWKRPFDFPSRRYSLFASPSKELAAKFGGAQNGQIYKLEILNGIIAQIPYKDARFHPEAQGSNSLQKLVLRLLGEKWINSDMNNKKEVSLLWAPCLTKSEMETLFTTTSLSKHKDAIYNEIKFWNDASLIEQNNKLPYSEGEIFFAAESWLMFPI